MNEFVIIMNKVYNNILRLKEDKTNDILYNEILSDLNKLDDMLDNNMIPSHMHMRVQNYVYACHRKIEYIRLKPRKIKG